MRHTLILAIALILPFSLSAQAEDINYNLYQLSAITEDEIDNDVMRVTLLATHQASVAAEANKVVNRQMTPALEVLKKTNGIRYETGNYQTQPIYQNQQIAGWKASQEVELKSTDFNQLSILVGKLQKDLKVTSMGFEVSKAVRQKAEQRLSVDALNQFKERALLIQKTMGASGYQVVSIDVNTDSHRPPVRYAMMRAEAATAYDSPGPAVEGGNSTIKVNVSGQIQLIFN
ncbi:SIMPL domain-containing protein [Alkalimarinus sediminis]|uniref:SIMPL domain-containing protein n=1 Tax=Alkalimarinus sediminis TaxID=1632866 RepID=A0A9E8KQK3_9ALTE|nr:SIMPL domain-containing protein [Alkalimarinus sediminis]UZW74842.1 SIMPL domain-containing protein [Alkalimarinus sediminis]